MELVATLLTDIPLDEPRFRGVLLDLSHSSLAGAILQHDLVATHAYGNAEEDIDVRDVRVRCLSATTAPPSALTELRKAGFQPQTALEFETDGDHESREDAWALVGLYAEELRGWVITSYVDFEEAERRCGTNEGLLHAPVGGKDRGVLISANTLRLLTP